MSSTLSQILQAITLLRLKPQIVLFRGDKNFAINHCNHQKIIGTEAFSEKAKQGGLLKLKLFINRQHKKYLGNNAFENTFLTIKSIFHNNKNIDIFSEENINAYFTYILLRKRDVNFNIVGHYKETAHKERLKKKETFFNQKFLF